MSQRRIPASLVRGGTSKGVYFERADLPADQSLRDDLLPRLFGSPDPMQLDGIGGSHSVTSKAMIISTADVQSVDIEYVFGQVGIEDPVVDWGGNCGNLTFGIGPFALERGLVEPDPGDAGRVDLVLRNVNTDTVVEQSVPVDPAGRPRYAGEFRVAGVPRPGARIRSRFVDPAGSTSGRLFPTGNKTDDLDVASVGTIEASIVDVTNPCVFVRAADVGITASELPGEIDSDPDALARLERIRSAACERLGFVPDRSRASCESPGIPKVAVVGERQCYRTVAGDAVEPDEYDLLARIMSMGTAHHAYAVSGSMCTATAALFTGTVPAEFLADAVTDAVRIGHPKGTMRVRVERDRTDVVGTAVDRTARPIMDGELYDPDPPSAEPGGSDPAELSDGDSA